MTPQSELDELKGLLAEDDSQLLLRHWKLVELAPSLIADIETLTRQRDELLTVMKAAAVEIQEHWDAHCDAEGYGPVNLVHRLEHGLTGGGYTCSSNDIPEMVNRFLNWELPKDFYPDGGVTFTPPVSPSHRWPVGTNLLTYAQAEQMFKACIPAKIEKEVKP